MPLGKLLLTLALAAWPASSSLEEALRLMGAERYDEAIAAFEEQARRQPGAPRVLLNLGWAYRRVNEPEQALRCWGLLLKLDPENPLYLRLVADVELERGETRRALSLAQSAQRLAPGDRDVALVLAKALHRAGRESEALELLEKLADEAPRDALSWQRISRAYSAMGRVSKALGAAEKALKLDPSSPESLYIKGELLEARQDWAGARELYERALERNPKSYRAAWSLARVAEAQRDYPRALGLVRGLREHSSGGPAGTLLGVQEARLLADSGRVQEAFRLLKRDFKAPDGGELTMAHPWVRARMLEAALWIRSGKTSRALRIYADLQRRGLSEPEILAQRGLAMERAGNDYEARRLYARASSMDPENDRFRRMLTRSQRKVGPILGSEVRSFSDSFDRTASKALLRFGTSIRSARFTGWLGKGSYAQADVPRVDVQETGMQVRLSPAPAYELSLLYSRLFSEEPVGYADNASLSASLSPLPELRLTALGRLASVETAPALREGRRYRSLGGELEWEPAFDWSASLQLEALRYNDSNAQTQARLEVGRRLLTWLSAGYSFVHLGSRRVVSEYFSPLRLNQHLVFAAMNLPFGSLSEVTERRRGDLRAQYGLGYGFEEGRNRNVHSLRASLGWNLADHLSLQAGFQFAQSPTYVSRTVTGGIGLSF